MAAEPALTLDGVTKRFGGLAVCDGIGFSVPAGARMALIGPNGAGKTTLFNLLSGLYAPRGGRVKFGGADVTGDAPHRLAQRGLSRTFQNLQIFGRMSAAENVMVGRHLHESHNVFAHLLALPGVRRQNRETRQKAEALLESVGLKGMGGKFPWQLSGGMQQRASLCRALIHEPKLLMLDEPFGALDAFTREELWCVIRDLHARMAGALTVILVTHDLREAVFLADRIFCMSSRPGRIIAEQEVAFPRPRDLEITYTPAFSDIVHDLRARIAQARAA